ncbi:glycosyltransferase [Silvibacterium dinghuense]|uniref:glycosyltransferase n=1 Tax=Silvibacterium dinghuense TaxID=1560006 RepID=UPI00195CF7E7|nr:glycosyltransferase [Silvibacterium dinghuense]GGH09227.1 hypothetical protein GCM10011586_27100 [Silvibacterium dinghuense]
MKVLFVDQTGQLGGGELSLLDLIRGTGHTAEVVLFTDGPFRKLLEEIPVRVHLLSAGGAGEVRREAAMGALLSAIPSFLQLRNKLAHIARDFDVIYANSQKAFIVSALAKQSRQPLLWHLRDMLSAEHFSKLLRKVAVFTGNHAADLIVANSEATLESLVASGGRRDKATVIYNGISPAPFDSISDEQVLEIRKKLGWEGRFVAGAFGRLSPWKGQHILLDAITSIPTLHVAIVGDALFGEKDYAESLRIQAQQHGIEDRVHFLGFRRDIPELMRAVDVVAHTATAPEPFGRVIVEGMLAKRPVIATRAGGALEIVRDKENGLLVSPGDSAALATALMQLQNHSELRVRLATNGRLSAEREFSIQGMIHGIDQAIHQLGASQ